MKLPSAAPIPRKLLSHWDQWQFPPSHSAFSLGLYIHGEKHCFNFPPKSKPSQDSFTDKKTQTKTPLEKNSQTDFSSSECIYSNTQPQTSKQKPNNVLRNWKMGSSLNHSQGFPVSQVPNLCSWRGKQGKMYLKAGLALDFMNIKLMVETTCLPHPGGCSSVRGLNQLLLTCRRHSGAQNPREILNIICLLIIASLRK